MAKEDDKPHTKGADADAVDLYRDTPVRYLGYANELGEAFRPIVPKLLVPSYCVSFGYVFADTIDKAKKANNSGKSSGEVTKAAADTLLWQSFASVIIPGFVIHKVVDAVKWTGEKAKFSPALRRWAPTAIGLSAIPFIIHPIDHFVDYAMDNTVRKMW
jgi:fission process protein 1|eukprot:g3441.t1